VVSIKKLSYHQRDSYKVNNNNDCCLPRLQNALGARDILKLVVRDRELNLLLNRYRYSEQRSSYKDLTDLIETLDGKPRELVRDLSHTCG